MINIVVGFVGGVTPSPTYRETCTGHTGHTEVVRVVSNPPRISYKGLLRIFRKDHDPIQGFRQDSGIGTQYRSTTLLVDTIQHMAAVTSRGALQVHVTEAESGEITTGITSDATFHYMEEERQQYPHKNPGEYCPNHATGVDYG